MSFRRCQINNERDLDKNASDLDVERGISVCSNKNKHAQAFRLSKWWNFSIIRKFRRIWSLEWHRRSMNPRFFSRIFYISCRWRIFVDVDNHSFSDRVVYFQVHFAPTERRCLFLFLTRSGKRHWLQTFLQTRNIPARLEKLARIRLHNFRTPYNIIREIFD